MKNITDSIKYLFRRRIEWDRKLIQGKFSTLLRILAIVICLPLFIWICLGILELSGLFKTEELITEGGLEIDRPRLWWSVLYHFIDPGNQGMTYGAGRAAALVLAIAGSIFMNGILISAIVGWYDRYVDKWRCGLARYDETFKRRKFMIIIGAHEAVASIICQLLKRENAPEYIIVQTVLDIEKLRGTLRSALTSEQEKRVVIYAGERTSEEDLRDLHPEWAMELFILGECIEEDSRELNHDALNLTALQIIAKILEKRKAAAGSSRLTCRVMFEYQTSFSIFQYSDISNRIQNVINFKPVNFYELWAQRIFVKDNMGYGKPELPGYLPLEGDTPIRESSADTVHLIIVGMSRMGVALAIEAAHLAHYPNFVNSHSKRSRITFIDEECGRERKYFQGRFKELFSLCRWREVSRNEDISALLDEDGWHNEENPDTYHLGKNFLDIEWEFLERSVEEEDVHKYLHAMAVSEGKRLTLAICLPDDNKSVAAAIYLPESIYENAVQILVYQYHNSAIINSISSGENRMNIYYDKLKAFGMMKDAFDDAMILMQEKIADILAGEYDKMYKTVKERHGIKDVSVEITRGKSKIAKYWSNVYNANSIWSKLRSIDYRAGEEIKRHDIDILSKTEHNRWVMEQLLMRYRALTPEEQRKAAANQEYKEELKGCKMAHLDICSSERLCEIDPDVTCFDEGFIKIIPDILKSLNEKIIWEGRQRNDISRPRQI